MSVRWLVGPTVGQLVGCLVCHNLPKGREVALSCNYFQAPIYHVSDSEDIVMTGESELILT